MPGSVARNAGREAEMLFKVDVQVRFIGDRSGLETLLDAVMEQLVKLNVTDLSIGGMLSEGDVEFSLAVDAETLEKATADAFGMIRAAILAVGGGTSGWPEFRGEAVTAQLAGA
jgi:hypothetical protein